MGRVLKTKLLAGVLRILAVAFPVLVLVAPGTAAAQPVCGDLHKETLYSTVLVEASGGTGSGTVVHSAQRDGKWVTLVLTNHHVIAGSVTVSKEWSPQEGKEVERERRQPVKVLWFDYNDCSRAVGTRGKKADIVAYDRRADLALLRIGDTERGVEHVAHLFPEGDVILLMDGVWAVGAGLGKPPFTTYGHIGILEEHIDGHPYLMGTAPIIFGNSGGGLFRYSNERKRHELIGVPSRVSGSGYQVVSHMAWSIVMPTIREFLRRNDYGFVLGDKPAAE